MTTSKRIVRNLATATTWLDREVKPWDNLPAADVRKMREALAVVNKLLEGKRE